MWCVVHIHDHVVDCVDGPFATREQARERKRDYDAVSFINRDQHIVAKMFPIGPYVHHYNRRLPRWGSKGGPQRAQDDPRLSQDG